jgi:microcystin-dependent protein
VDPFLGEIRMFGGNFAPLGWAFCEGQLLAIADNDALFALIGTTYGGDGQETFALPDLRGRAPLHMGTGASGTPYPLGDQGGVETVTLTTDQTAAHSHNFMASTVDGNSANPGATVVVAKGSVSPYVQDVVSAQMAQASVTPAGGSQPHENRQPYLAIRFIIALEGIFPSQG